MLNALLYSIGSLFNFGIEGTKRIFHSLMAGAFCLTVFLFQAISRDMTATSAVKLGFLWLVSWVLWSLAILSPSMVKKVAVAVFVVGLAIVGQTLEHFAPGTVSAAKLIADYRDMQNLAEARLAIVEVLETFDCNKDNAGGLKFFGQDGRTKARVPRIFWARDPDSGRIVCSHKKGLYPKDGQEMKWVDEDTRKEIAGQPPLIPPVRYAEQPPQRLPAEQPPQPSVVARTQNRRLVSFGNPALLNENR